MIAVFARLGRGVEESIAKLAGKDVLLVEPSLVSTKKQLELALHLALKAFEGEKNIARDFKLEFLLWLTGKTDIKSALSCSRPKGKEALVVIFSGDKKNILRKIGAEETRKKLEDKFDAVMLERISLSRVIN
jgi:tRNA threonylcarbamoyladenosine modification (KEOPS) complex Cgi121 subunit